MNQIQNYPLTITAGAASTQTSQVYIGQSESVLLQIPGIVANYTSGVVAFRLLGSYASGASSKTMYFYDYVNKTPAECVITVSTGGMYEIPNAGGAAFIKLQSDVAATQSTQINLLAPRITY